METGGYQIIDFKGVQFELNTGQTIKGVYDQLESTRKAILLSGLNVGGTEYHDIFPSLKVSGTDYTLDCYGYTITITDDDLVTITN